MGERKRLPFDEIRKIPITEVLAYYNIGLVPHPTEKGEFQFVGSCPFQTHRGDNQGNPFKVTPSINAFRCCSPCCVSVGRNGGGNVITFVQAKERFAPDSDGYYQAAKLLGYWFRIPGCEGGREYERNQPEEQRKESQVVEASASEVTTIKAERYMETLDRELRDLLIFDGSGLTFGEWRDKVIKELKAKILESYRNGQKSLKGG